VAEGRGQRHEDRLGRGAATAATASALRRRDDPTRLAPWLRDRSKPLANVPEALLRVLLRFGRIERWPRGHCVKASEHRHNHVYIVISGTLVERVEADGRQRELSSFGAAGICGTARLMSAEAVLGDVTAEEATELLDIDALRIDELRAAYHPAATTLMVALAPLAVAELAGHWQRTVELIRAKNASMRTTGTGLSRRDAVGGREPAA
jgi:CRP-like cAMP-binding protein